MIITTMVPVLREKWGMHTHMHCPAVYSRFKVKAMGHMKNGLSKMDISLKFILKTFGIQTFFNCFEQRIAREAQIQWVFNIY